MGITLTLIIVIFTSLISYQAFSNHNMKQKLIFHPVSINERNEWYRFITHGFLHGDLMHLLINMYVLYVFGSQVEDIFTMEGVRFNDTGEALQSFGPVKGRIIFVVLYFGAIIISSISNYFKHKENNYYMALGASGGTSAIVFAYIMFDPWGWFTFPPLPGILLGIAYLLYSTYMDKKGGDNIGHNAHFWGAVFGFLFTALMFFIYSPGLLNRFFEKLLAGPGPPPFFG